MSMIGYTVTKEHEEFIKQKLQNEIRYEENAEEEMKWDTETYRRYKLVGYITHYETWMKELDEFVKKFNKSHMYHNIITGEIDLEAPIENTDVSAIIKKEMNKMGYVNLNAVMIGDKMCHRIIKKEDFPDGFKQYIDLKFKELVYHENATEPIVHDENHSVMEAYVNNYKDWHPVEKNWFDCDWKEYIDNFVKDFNNSHMCQYIVTTQMVPALYCRSIFEAILESLNKIGYVGHMIVYHNKKSHMQYRKICSTKVHSEQSSTISE